MPRMELSSEQVVEGDRTDAGLRFIQLFRSQAGTTAPPGD